MPRADWALCALRAIEHIGGIDTAGVALIQHAPSGEVLAVESEHTQGPLAQLVRELLLSFPNDSGGIDRSARCEVETDQIVANIAGQRRETPVCVACCPVTDEGLTLVVAVCRSGMDATLPSQLEVLTPRLAVRARLAFQHGTDDLLTSAELGVLDHLLRGRSVKDIAAIMSRSPHTIHDHVKSLHRKLGASSRGELIVRALGLVPDEPMDI